jgi:hypothetical protein
MALNVKKIRKGADGIRDELDIHKPLLDRIEQDVLYIDNKYIV